MSLTICEGIKICGKGKGNVSDVLTRPGRRLSSVLKQQPVSMGRKRAVHSTVLLLLLSVISTNNSHNINFRGDSSQVLAISDGSGGGSQRVASIAEVTDVQTESNLIEQSSPELNGVQKQFFSTGNQTFSSVEKLVTVVNLPGCSETNNVANTTTSPSINNTDTIIKREGNREFLQQTNNENFSSFPKFDDLPSLHNNHTEDNNASFLNSDPSYSVTADYVTPQQYVGDVYIDSNNGTIITCHNYNNSLSAEDNSEHAFDESSSNQLINGGPDVYQGQIEDQSDSDTKQNQYVNLENYNTSEIQNGSFGESMDDVLLDSPTAELLNNSFDSEDIFEKVFNISVDDFVDSEQKHYSNYQADSERRVRGSPGSNIQVSGSNTEQYPADNENMMFNNVFEVYRYSRKPDGVTQNKTLAQHIEELVLNRLPSSNKSKENDQVESGDREDDNISLDVEISPDEIGESDDEGTHSGASLAFVFDSTGSMWDDLVQVKMGAERIMATMLELPDKPIYNYVLVPFHDPRK
jgi:hypothetical protein